MGAPTKTLIEALTDRTAAILQLGLNGLLSEALGATLTSMAIQVDGAGDQVLEAALMSAALGVDEQSLPTNHRTAVNALVSRTTLRQWASDLNTLVTGPAGGSYDSFNAYLAAKSAAVHPLFAELFRAVRGEAAFTTSGDVLNVFAPSYTTRSADRVYQGADGSLSEETTDAASSATGDVTLVASNNHAVYIGSRYKFGQVVIALSQLANVTIAPSFQYWNGNAWATLTVTDNSTGLTKNDTIKFTPPSDWERAYKDGGGTAFADVAPLYYIRIARTASTVNTLPIGTCIRIVPTAVLNGTSSARHLGVPQPPLGIARVTATNTLVVESIVDADYLRFAEPAIQLVALTPIGSNLTVTISYVSEDGTNQTQAQSSWTAPAALGTKAISLNGSDTGVRSVRTTGWAVTTAATEGVFAIEAPSLRTPAL
jgi:hypothetical protein